MEYQTRLPSGKYYKWREIVSLNKLCVDADPLWSVFHCFHTEQRLIFKYISPHVIPSWL